MSYQETVMGEDRDKEQIDKEQQPSVTREGGMSRRRFLGLSALAGAGVLVGGAVFRGVTSAEIGRPVDLLTTFANLRKEQKDLLQKPDIIYDFFLNKDAKGEVTDIDIIAQGYDPKGAKAGRILYRTSMEGESLSRIRPIAGFPFIPTSVIRHNGVLVCGDYQSSTLAMQYAPDGVSFRDIPDLPKDKGFVVEAKVISGTNKSFLVMGYMQSGEAFGTFNHDTLKFEEVLAEGGWGASTGLAIANANGTARLISSAVIHGAPENGYLDATFDLSTNRTISAGIKHSDKGAVYNIFTTFSAAGEPENIFVNTLGLEMYIVDGKTGEVPADRWLQYTGWLNTPDMLPGSLNLDPIFAKGRTVWSAGCVALRKTIDGVNQNFPYLVAKSIPRSGADFFEAYPLVDASVDKSLSVFGDNLQFGKLNGKNCLFTYIHDFGMAVLEINEDGTPIIGAKPVYIGGLGELPKTHKIYIPYTPREYKGEQ